MVPYKPLVRITASLLMLCRCTYPAYGPRGNRRSHDWSADFDRLAPLLEGCLYRQGFFVDGNAVEGYAGVLSHAQLTITHRYEDRQAALAELACRLLLCYTSYNAGECGSQRDRAESLLNNLLSMRMT